MYDRAISTGNIHNLVYIPSTFCVGALERESLVYANLDVGLTSDVGRRRGVQLAGVALAASYSAVERYHRH